MRSTIVIVSLMVAGPALAQLNTNTNSTAKSPEVAAALTALEKVCMPLASGSNLKSVAPASGLRQQNGDWVLPINGPEVVDVTPPDTANPHVCFATIRYRGDQGGAIQQAIGAWAVAQTPPMTPGETNMVEKGPQMQRTLSSWEGSSPKAADTVIFAVEKTLDGKPVDGVLNEAQLTVSVSPANPT